MKPDSTKPFYYDFGELRAAGSYDLRTYGTEGTTIGLTPDGTTYQVTDGTASFAFAAPHLDIRSLRSNLVVRWEWLPGSTLFLVWQQNRFQSTTPTRDVGPGGLIDALSIPGDLSWR